jgi:hypothetical protein
MMPGIGHLSMLFSPAILAMLVEELAPRRADRLRALSA